MNQPDPAEIEAIAATLSIAKKTGAVNTWLDAYRRDVDTLLAALATAEERADKAEFQAEKYATKAAAAEAVVEAAKPISKWLGKGIGGENNAKKLFDALANYHKATGPQAENEEGS